MQNKLQKQIFLAIMAAIYVVLTIAVAPFAYGVVQFRISEMLNHLMAYNKKYIISLGSGVFIANLFSSAGLTDVIVGTLATLLSCIISIIAFTKIKNEFARLLFNIFNFTFIGMLPIALMLYFIGVGEATIIATYLMLIPGEFVAMSLGAIVFYFINKTLKFESLV